MDAREEKEKAQAEEQRKRFEEEAAKGRRVFIIGAMKSGNPFQIALGEMKIKDAADRVRRSLQRGEVEVLEAPGEGDASAVIIRWSDMESCLVITQAEMEKRDRMQRMAAQGRR